MPENEEQEPRELSLEYFESNPATYSSRVLANLRSNSIFRFLFDNKGKGPTNRDMLIVASTVISSADEEIRRLEFEKHALQRQASKIRAVLSNPLWSARQLPPPAAEAPPAEQPSSPESTAAAEKAKQDAAEYTFMAKYLTVGNTLGALVVIIGMLGGLVTYLTTNFKDRAESAEKTSTYWHEQATAFEKEAEGARAAQKHAEGALISLQQADAKTIGDLKTAAGQAQTNITNLNKQLTQSQTLSSTLTNQLKDANIKIEQLQRSQSAR